MPALLERITRQAVELLGNGGRADDGEWHVVRQWFVKCADVGERECEHQYQRGHEHERHRLRRGCRGRHHTLSRSFS